MTIDELIAWIEDIEKCGVSGGRTAHDIAEHIRDNRPALEAGMQGERFEAARRDIDNFRKRIRIDPSDPQHNIPCSNREVPE